MKNNINRQRETLIKKNQKYNKLNDKKLYD